MKTILLAIFSFLFVLNLSAQVAKNEKAQISKDQAAREILAKSSAAYRALINYVDEGDYVLISPLGPQYNRTIHYYIALDTSRNIYHRYSENFQGNTVEYAYLLLSGKEFGTYTIKGENPVVVSSNLTDASARFGGIGSGLLYDLTSLMYPTIYTGANSQTPFAPYTSLTTLRDTTIGGQSLYVVELTNQYELSQDKIDRTKRTIDSLNYVRALRTNPNAKLSDYKGTSNFYEEAGTKTHVVKYYIRKKDNLIVRKEELMVNGDNKIYKLSYKLSPRTNVTNFKTYITPK